MLLRMRGVYRGLESTLTNECIRSELSPLEISEPACRPQDGRKYDAVHVVAGGLMVGAHPGSSSG